MKPEQSTQIYEHLKTMKKSVDELMRCGFSSSDDEFFDEISSLKDKFYDLYKIIAPKLRGNIGVFINSNI
jgi:hypothetical protein